MNRETREEVIRLLSEMTGESDSIQIQTMRIPACMVRPGDRWPCYQKPTLVVKTVLNSNETMRFTFEDGRTSTTWASGTSIEVVRLTAI